jgi:hypothetical protein
LRKVKEGPSRPVMKKNKTLMRNKVAKVMRSRSKSNSGMHVLLWSMTRRGFKPKLGSTCAVTSASLIAGERACMMRDKLETLYGIGLLSIVDTNNHLITRLSLGRYLIFIFLGIIAFGSLLKNHLANVSYHFIMLGRLGSLRQNRR